MKVHVYKEYYDNYAYGEEIIRVFEDRDEAEKYLKKRVEQNFETEWENVPQVAGIDLHEDTFEKDYVSICDGNGTAFWIIESYETIRKGEAL